jgi:hypothetical protein
VDLSGIPYVELHFTADGGLRPAAADAMVAASGAVTDALVLVHGWNTDTAGAQLLYRRLAERLAPLPGTLIVGVVWPSTRIADADNTRGSAASAGTSDAALAIRLDGLARDIGEPGAVRKLTAAAAAIPRLETEESARREFVEAVREALRAATGRADGDEEAPDAFFTLDGAELMDRLSRPGRLRRPPGGSEGGAASAGGAAGFDILGGIRGAARNLLDFTTYYLMKDRAGTVGGRGLAPVLAQLRAARPRLRLHLVGHSFGARLVSAAATGSASGQALPVASMTLLQGAFSHYAFARNWKPGHHGAFRDCLTGGRIDGPVLVTHTANDRAVGIAYALASRAAGQIAAAVGGPDDVYGGIGRNGALSTPEARTGSLLDVGGAYDLRPGVVHNLLADRFVSGHSDVTGPQVAHALRSALAVGAPVG